MACYYCLVTTGQETAKYPGVCRTAQQRSMVQIVSSAKGRNPGIDYLAVKGGPSLLRFCFHCRYLHYLNTHGLTLLPDQKRGVIQGLVRPSCKLGHTHTKTGTFLTSSFLGMSSPQASALLLHTSFIVQARGMPKEGPPSLNLSSCVCLIWRFCISEPIVSLHLRHV